ncbi:hypothetical protein JCM17961_49050 [Endothiovibrio diazotrophicus]
MSEGANLVNGPWARNLDARLPDAMVAGIAAASGLTAATRNEAEFRHSGVGYVNPWALGASE